MADPNLDELNSVTLKEIFPRAITDNFFLATPLLAYWRDHCLVPFTGGAFMSSPIRYAPLIGGFYAPGSSFNLTKRQTITSLQFNPKYAYVSIPEYKEEIQVENKGPNAIASLLEADMQNGVDTINVIVAVASNQNGQNIAATGDRTLSINGWVEALNDGVTNSYDGNVYTTYGEQTRNGALGNTLNSIPFWCGTQTGATAPISYAVLEEGYQDASIGKKEPNLGVGNKAVYAYIKEKIQVQQRFQQERDPVWGVMGFRFNNAVILKDDYFPSLRYGVNDPILGNYLTSSFTSASTVAAASNMPASTACTVGEVFCFFNTYDYLFRVTDNEEFGFGFSGFVPAQDNTRVVGQIKAMVNMQCLSPRTSKQFFGIGG